MRSTASPGADVAYQLNATHTGSLSNEGLTLPLHVNWMINFLGEFSYPIVAGNDVYVTAGTSLLALDARTGQTLWQHQQIQNPPQSYGGWAGAAYDNGVVFAVQWFVFSGPAIFAFNATTGAQLWAVTLPGEFAFTSPPTALNGVVYTGGSGLSGTVYALSESTGSILWTQTVVGGDASSPAVTSDKLYVSYACPQTYSLNVRNGAILWHYAGPCEGGGGTTPVLFDKSLYVGSAYNAADPLDAGVIFNANSGKIEGTEDYGMPAFANGIGYAIHPFQDTDQMVAFDAKKHTQIWTANPAPFDTFVYPPIVVDGVVYDFSDSGTLYAVDAVTGRQLQALQLNLPIFESNGFQLGLGVAPGTLFVPDGTSLYALSTAPTPTPSPTRTPRTHG